LIQSVYVRYFFICYLSLDIHTSWRQGIIWQVIWCTNSLLASYIRFYHCRKTHWTLLQLLSDGHRHISLAQIKLTVELQCLPNSRKSTFSNKTRTLYRHKLFVNVCHLSRHHISELKEFLSDLISNMSTCDYWIEHNMQFILWTTNYTFVCK